MVTVANEIHGVKEGFTKGRRTVLGCPFSRVTITGDKRRSTWSVVVKCECGRVDVTTIRDLLESDDGNCVACAARKNQTTHGESRWMANTRLYRIWWGMRRRCDYPKYINFNRYGGRGIRVCDEWSKYEVFREWALANGYQDNLTIDRINNDGNYEPRNCQWLTRAENSRKARVKVA